MRDGESAKRSRSGEGRWANRNGTSQRRRGADLRRVEALNRLAREN